MNYKDLGEAIGVAPLTLIRWENGTSYPSPQTMEALYSYAYENKAHKIKLNYLKSQLRFDDKGRRILLFHGSDGQINEPIDAKHTKGLVDFGSGFYAGESFEQAGSWVAGKPSSSVYMLYFQPSSQWKHMTFTVDLDWLFAVAHYRKRIDLFEGSARVRKIVSAIEKCDYLIAPIADNTMYDTIDSFIQGLITSEQCLHCLTATNLGSQYVFLTNSVCKKLELTDRLYLSKNERDDLLAAKDMSKENGTDKVKASLIAYRGKGRYIEELLKDEKI